MADDPIHKVKKAVIDKVGEHREWWELPLPAALMTLSQFRDDLRELNLYDTEAPRTAARPSRRAAGPPAPTTAR